tara:strand:- start:461 stop:643 length:183 start_codon:yes stop_codon:yes gene_type:complete
MKPGDLVRIKYEKPGKYYIIYDKAARSGSFGEEVFVLLNLKDGSKKNVGRYFIEIISEAA